jgi:pimeloyl-ACP methyl ester carboxylesterase
MATVAPVALGYWAWRRRIERAIRSDDEWAELTTTLPSTTVAVTSADGTRLHAEVLGPEGAPTIVLVHGWCCSVRFWHYQLLDLSPDYRIVAYDLRGHGRSQRPGEGDYSTTALANDLDAVLRACVPEDEPVVVAGHSMGGMSLVAWADAHADELPRRLAGAVLVDTAMAELVRRSRIFPTVSHLAEARTALGGVVLGLPVPLAPPPDPITYWAIRFVALARTARPAQVGFCAQMVAECPPRVRAAFGMTLARLDLRHCLPKLAVRTFVLVGSDDVLTPPEQAYLIAEEAPSAEVFVLPGSGHMAPVEKHSPVTAHIRVMAEKTLARR